MNNKSELGIENNIDEINIDELFKSKTALKMLLHNHQKLEYENTMLKQDLQRQSTYQRGIEKRETYSKIAGIFALFSTIILGFGINFVTNNVNDIKGWIFVILGIVFQILNMYFSFRKVDDNV